MKYFEKVTIILSVVFMLAACQSDNIRTSKLSGYDYKVYDDRSGRAAEVGDYVYFHMDIYNDSGELLQSYRNQKQMPSVRIADPTDPARKKNPLVDVMASLSLEDSIGIIVPRDSIPALPPQYSDIQSLEYRIVVKDILTEEENIQKIEKERELEAIKAQEFAKRLPGIRDLAITTVRDFKSDKLEFDLSPKGVKYIIHERGEGDIPAKDRMVTVQYYGLRIDTEELFDNSFEKGRGYTFRLGRNEVIAGWDDAVPLLPVGTRASLFVPSELAYGTTGFQDIPPDTDLYFYVEIEDMYF